MNDLYFTYHKVESPTPYLVVEKVDPLVKLVQIPEEIQGIPIRELEAYVFSGGEHTEICLPKGIRKIGRYAFYNCYHLQKLQFGSGITDIGSGAFTGCHKVERLDVLLEEEYPSCLKEVLSELPEQLEVRLHGEEESRLFFPEYYEEGVENTPARILMTQVHGSGIWYRNCFQQRQINYLEYDRCFEKALAQESFSFNLQLASARLRYPHQLTEEGRMRYEEFIKKHLEEALLFYLERNQIETLTFLLTKGELTQEEADRLCEKASLLGNARANAAFLDYRRSHFETRRQRRHL